MLSAKCLPKSLSLSTAPKSFSYPKSPSLSTPQAAEVGISQTLSGHHSPRNTQEGGKGRGAKLSKPWLRFILVLSLSCFVVVACLLLYLQLPPEVLKHVSVGLLRSGSSCEDEDIADDVQCSAMSQLRKTTTVVFPNRTMPILAPSNESFVPLPDALNPETDTCWSRQERHLYLKSVKHRPATAFIHAVRDYEAYHARCTEGVNDSSAQFWKGGRGDCKYVVYLRGDGGMGNRLLSLASAFVYALLTGRVLLVDTTYLRLDKIFCNPFPPSPFFVQFNQLENAPRLADYLKADATSRGDSALVFIEWDSTPSDTVFYCAETQEQIANVTWLGFNSDTYAVPHMHLISRFRKRLEELFPDHVMLFHILHYLLHPANDLWERIRSVHQSYLDHSDKLIGIQIRTFSTYDPEVNARVLQCLHERGSVPQLMPQKQHEKLHEALYARARKFLNRAPSSYLTLLVTSLDASYYESLKQTYTEHATEDGSVVRVHMESKDGEQLPLSLDQDQKATIEMWLLSFADDLFISHTSTFGYIAAALGGRSATSMNIVDRRRDLGWSWRDGGQVCEEVLIEPCQQVVGPDVTCEADGYHTRSYEDDSRKVVNKQLPLYIQPCVDFMDRGGKRGLGIRLNKG